MTEPALLEPPAATGVLAELVLVRLLPSKQSLGAKKLLADLAPLFRRPPSADAFAAALAGLRADGLLTAKGQRLTDAGRTRALAFVGASELPPRATWESVKAKFLVPKALGVPEAAGMSADALAALLVVRKFGLPSDTRLTLKAVVDTLAFQALGLPPRENATPADFRAALVAKQIGASALTGKQLKDDAVRLVLGTKSRGVGALRANALAGLGDTAGRSADEPFDLEAFAETVKSVARTCPTGRFGDNKVFLSHVWDQLRDEPRFAPLGLDGFKQKLVEANRAALLTLSRADLAQIQDPDDLERSETKFLNAEYHFILTEKE